jgi:hypothetical protein
MTARNADLAAEVLRSTAELLLTTQPPEDARVAAREVTFAAQRLQYYLERLDDTKDHKLPYSRVTRYTDEYNEHAVQPYMATHKLIYETRAYLARMDLWLAYRRFVACVRKT